ncbi:MAG: hypothetical protein GY943_09935 [Chloroflexi bacterium]|nr:hypothetical protein [Chloroflexota bacterium]
MGIQITVNLPNDVYQRLQREAAATNRNVAELASEKLSATVPRFDIHPRHAEMEVERAAFLKMHAELWQKYPYQYVAVFQGEVVDHDDDELTLLERRNEKYPDDIVLIRQVLREPERTIVIRSPRLIRKSK